MIQRLAFLGVRASSPDAFAATVGLYRELLGLEPFLEDETSVRFRAADGAEIHVYELRRRIVVIGLVTAGLGAAPVVGLVVDDFDAARARMVAAGIAFEGEPQRAGSSVWNHYRAPDGNVYEIMGRVAADG